MKRIKKITAYLLCILTLFGALSLSSSAVAVPEKPELFMVTDVGADSVSLSWSACKNATGYRIYSYLDGKWKAVKDTTSTAVTINNLSASKSYVFAVRSARKYFGEIYFCNGYSSLKIRTRELVATKLSGVGGADYVDLKWERVPGADGYAVYQYMSAGWNRIGTTKKLAGRVKNLQPGAGYHFAVRAYTNGDGKAVQGPASNFLKVKTTDPNKVNVVCSAVTDSALKLNWTTAPNADGYRIYSYLSGEWKPVKDIMSASVTSHIFKNLKSDTGYYFRVRAFKKTASTVKWYQPSEICTVVTDPGVRDVYVYRIDALRSVLSGDAYTLSYETVNKKYGNIPVTVAKKGNNYYLGSRVNEMPFELINNENEFLVVLDEAASYVKVPELVSGLFDVNAIMGDFLPGTDWSSKANIGTFNSQKVVCESFTNPERTKRIIFYYKQGVLVGIDEIGITGLEERAVVEKLVASAEDELFLVPEGYTRLFYGSLTF